MSKEEEAVRDGVAHLFTGGIWAAGLIAVFSAVVVIGPRLSNHATHPSRYVHQGRIISSGACGDGV
jgi:hypothetical protein